MRRKLDQVREQADPKRRLNIVLPEQSWGRLERIKDEIEADTFTEVVKESFRLMEYVLQLERSGSRLLLRKPNGDVTELEIFQLRPRG